MNNPVANRILIVLLILFASAPAIGRAQNSIAIPFRPSKGFIGYVPDEIVIQLTEEVAQSLNISADGRQRTGLSAMDQVGERFKAASIRRQFPGAKQKRHQGRTIDLSGWHKIKFSDKVPIETAIDAYKALPQVMDAQPIGIHAFCAAPNDGRYSHQWHLNQGIDHDMDAPETWENLKAGLAAGRIDLENIVVAVLDSGVRYFHKDLGGSGASFSNPANVDGNMWINGAEKNGEAGVDDDGNGFVDDWVGWDFVESASDCWSGEDCSTKDNDPRDFNGHGTHCAGNVAAITNNAYSTASPAGGWGSGTLQAGGNGVKVMALRVGWSMDDGGQEVGVVRMDYAAEALYYADGKGAKIASCSWGSSDTGGIGAAIDHFLAGGGMVFKAAGNDNRQFSRFYTDYMCQRSDMVCVAATDQNDCKASFSNYDSAVDISAPGVAIESLYHYNPNPGTDYTATISGTSMATPLAASTAALIWAQNPTWTADQVTTKILDSADDIDSLACNSSYSGKLGSGRVNLYQATYVDADGDGVHDWSDGCPSDPDKAEPGSCGCGSPETDADGDGTPDCNDGCPDDGAKTEPGHCGCGVPDSDADGDGTPDCNDGCPDDGAKTEPGHCGCGVPDSDADGDGTPDCNDGCPDDGAKTEPGHCGCGVPDSDADGDGTPDCNDGCPTDPQKIAPGACGCGVADTDSDGDGIFDCIDNCVGVANPDQLDQNDNGIGDVCEVVEPVPGPVKGLLAFLFVLLTLLGRLSIKSEKRFE